MKLKLITTALAALVATATLASANTLDTIKAAKAVKAGYANTKPFSYLDESGKLTGQAIELARVTFAGLGAPQIDGVLIEFSSLIPALQASQFDVIAASMAIRPQRCEQILFSDPYSAVRMVLVHKNGTAGEFKDFETLAKTDAIFGVQAGAVEAKLAKDAGVKNIVEFPDLAALRDGVRTGRANVLMTVTIAVDDTMKALGDGFTASAPFAPMVNGKPQVNFQAFGFRKGDEALRDAFNAEVAKLRSSGELAKIFSPFGLTQADIDLAASQSAEALCKG